jgi:acyl-CoA thioesterase
VALMTLNCDKGDLSEIECLSRESDSSSFARLMDLKIIKADRGYALAEITISAEKHLNFRGGTHGAVIFAVADHACGLCGNSLGRKSVLIHSSINLFANPTPGSVVRAEARMVHEDKTSGSMVIDVKTGTGDPLARLQSTVLFFNQL